MRKLTYKQDQKLFLILDNHRVHHAKKVQKWLEKYVGKIALFYLPPYAPELNPDELLNQTIKQKIKHKAVSTNQKQFKNKVSSCVKSIQKSSHTIKSFFLKPELLYIKKAI